MSFINPDQFFPRLIDKNLMASHLLNLAIRPPEDLQKESIMKKYDVYTMFPTVFAILVAFVIIGKHSIWGHHIFKMSYCYIEIVYTGRRLVDKSHQQ